MGISVHRASCIKRFEGRRDETQTIKTNWSPGSAAKTKEKPAGMNRRGWCKIAAATMSSAASRERPIAAGFAF
jgi:hypothetical protein